MIGGIDLASEWAGFTTVGQVEIDDYCRKVLEKHWPDVPRWRDVRDVTRESVSARGIERVTLLSGGFPCQPHSCAGKRKASADERDLWGEFARVIREIEPVWVLAENVRGLLSSESNRFFGRVLRDLADMGYSVGWCCYGANAVGAPHQRERVFIVAYSRHNGPHRAEGDAAQQGSDQQENWISVRDDKDVAHTPITQRKPGAEIEGVLRAVSADQREHDNADGPGAAQSGDVADTAVIRREGFYQVPRGNGEEQEKRRLPESSGGSIGPTQSCLGRVPPGISAGMDGVRWPAGWWPTPGMMDGLRAGKADDPVDWAERRNSKAEQGINLHLPLNIAVKMWPSGPGAQQHEWEPPRIVKGVPNRVQRLKALGNAVVPAQVYPILQAIADIEGRC